jgi:hypothetical protein
MEITSLCVACDTFPVCCDRFVISELYAYKQVAIVLKSFRK